MAKNQKSYTPKFKQQIVDLYNAGGTSYPKLEREYGVNRSTLSNWVKCLWAKVGRRQRRTGLKRAGYAVLSVIPKEKIYGIYNKLVSLSNQKVPDPPAHISCSDYASSHIPRDIFHLSHDPAKTKRL